MIGPVRAVRVFSCPVTGRAEKILGFLDECEAMADQLSEGFGAYTFCKSFGSWAVGYSGRSNHSLSHEVSDVAALAFLEAGDLAGLAAFYHSARCWVYGRQSDDSFASVRALAA